MSDTRDRIGSSGRRTVLITRWFVVGVLLLAAACGGGGAETGYDPNFYTKQMYEDTLEEIREDSLNGCDWSMGCGMAPGAHSGVESNTLTGGDDIEPLN